MEKLIFGLCLTFLLQLAGCEQLVNIALHKTPTQNGTLQYPPGNFWNVSRSVDGMTECTIPVDGQHYSATALAETPWWQLDLGSIYDIKAMHLLGRPDTPLQLGGFRLWAGLDSDNLSMMYKDNEETYNNGSIWVNNTRIIARIIKIDLPRDNATKRIAPGPLTLCEVKVLILSVEANIKNASSTSGSGVHGGFGSHLAIDGKYPSASAMTPELCSCCSITTGTGTLWWTIDFGQPRLIGRIYITGRRDIKYQNQSKDLSIFVSSASLEPSSGRFGDFVWNITSSETGNFFQHTFNSPTLFRYMSITQPGTSKHYMTLCEVDFSAVECQKGHYGTGCIETCGHCIDGNTTCSASDGTCSAGCAAGYNDMDAKCKTECQKGHYGTGCIETCGHCIDGYTTCSVTDGTCSAGCAPGYDRIDKTCKTCTQGYFGPGCIETCGHCIDGNTTCSVTDGTCSAGCAAGYDRIDKTCKTCTQGYFGTGCIETCGHCIDGNTTCTVKDGTCSAGCAAGYNPTDTKCKKVCSPGQYGLNCSEDCGQCINGTTSCLNNDGSCPGGCAPGYDPQDITCKRECQHGQYGLNCSKTCGHCVEDNNTCNKKDGSCPGGCAAGFNFTADRTCIANCSDRHYGLSCQEICGNCSEDSTCLPNNGTCVAGCAPGYDFAANPACKQACQDGKFGQNCSETCGKCSGGSIHCSKIDGVCLLQCDDGYKGANCQDSQDKNNNVGMIVGAVVSVFVIVISVVVLVFVLKRRGRLPKRRATRTHGKADSDFVNLETLAMERETQRKKADKEETSVEQNHSRENGGYYSFNPGDHVTNSIQIRDLWEYITKNRANNFEDLFVEFQKVPGGLKFECLVAQRDENVGKNKYRNMYPYDNCRVKLKVAEGQTDYINASHVDGYERIQKFIAAQGPQKGTIEDFWLMVWQQGVRKVVMLTNIFEMGKDKCEQYWPNEGTSIQYGRIEVTSKETTEKSDYCIRQFELRMGHEKLRRVDQFHFKSWPDKDVPDSTWCLVNFWRVAMNKDHGKSPIVVHCSAGIGRTGTFIALDSLYHQAMAEGGIRPLSVIETLRRQRINMVQTKYQYTFLHEALADALLVGTHFFWASQLPSVCNFFRGCSHEASVTRAQEQFNLICECVSSSEGQQQTSPSSAAGAENIYEETGEPMAEPEYGNISTLQSEISEYRPKTKDRNSASIQQMNAIYLPNYAEASTYILAETPSESSLPEFWSMVEEQNVTTIVNLTETTHPYFQTSCTLGANGGKPVGRFVVNIVKEVKHKEYTIRSIVYKEEDKESNAGFTVKIFSLSAWQQFADCPSDLDPLMALLEEVNKWHPYVSEAKPMLFICSDGRTRCGLVAAILNETQRMRNEEGHVNIVETVMTMKKRAGDVISAEQFQFVYEAVLAYALRMGYVLDTGDYNNI